MSVLLDLTYRLKTKLKRYLTGQRVGDDFDWDYYTFHYRAELERGSQEHSLILKPDDYRFEDNRLTRKSSCLPLHPNHRLLYETLLQLRPASLMEIGCGGGDHLNNLALLEPAFQLSAIDLSEDQLALARRRHPAMQVPMRQFDVTSKTGVEQLTKVEVAYTQAVIMHIRVPGNYLQALVNLFHIASRKLVLMENWKNHDFMGDMRKLSAQGKLPWPELHFYYRESEELKKPHLMIVSSEPLPQYPKLEDYGQLLGSRPLRKA